MTTDPTPPPRPLAGLRVLEMGALIAGPFCTKILARVRRRRGEDRAARHTAIRCASGGT